MPIIGVLINHQFLKNELIRDYRDEARQELGKELDVPIEEIAKPKGGHVTIKGEEWVEDFNLSLLAYQPRLKKIYRLEYLINHDRSKYKVMGHYAIYFYGGGGTFRPKSVHVLTEE